MIPILQKTIELDKPEDEIPRLLTPIKTIHFMIRLQIHTALVWCASPIKTYSPFIKKYCPTKLNFKV